MGSMGNNAKDLYAAANGVSPLCFTDYNELTHSFIRELSFRSHGDTPPHCLFIDVEEGGDAMRMVSKTGSHSERLVRDNTTCLGKQSCAHWINRSGQKTTCGDFTAYPADQNDSRKKINAFDQQDPFELVMSCHSISFIPNPRARCFLSNLRHVVRAGGMLFISALGSYSQLGDDYPGEEMLLEARYAPLKDNAAFHLAPDTKLCLYSERDLCNTLFDAGWSVVKSSTTTENNVLAIAIRV